VHGQQRDIGTPVKYGVYPVTWRLASLLELLVDHGSPSPSHEG
jgi:hypothetical protein